MEKAFPADVDVLLRASTDPIRRAEQLTLLTTLLNNCETKISHFDSLRQQNLMIALAIFAGLFGFGVSSKGMAATWLVTGALVTLMTVFWLLDHQHHKYSEGWQGTRRSLTRSFVQTINEPESDIRFLRYDVSAERRTRLLGWQPGLYLLLLLGGAFGPVIARACR